MFCPVCNELLPEDSRFCPECGANLTVRSAYHYVPEPPVQEQDQAAPEIRWKHCIFCGVKIPEDSRFCPECGEDQGEESVVRQPIKTAAPVRTQAQTRPAKPAKPPRVLTEEEQAAIRKRNKIIGTVFGAAAAVVLVIGLLSIFIKPSINLNDYITVSFEGYDSIGTARAEFDQEAFLEDHGERLAEKISKTQKKQYKPDMEDLMVQAFMGYEAGYGVTPESAVRQFLSDCVEGNLDESRELNNGDQITFVWDCDPELALEVYGYNLKFSDIPYTVEGLEIPGEFDPFEDVTITFEGTAPYGRARLDDGESILSFEMDVNSDLSNGDTITVTAVAWGGEDLDKYCLERVGMLPSVTSKTYTVEGLDCYVTQLSQIPQTSLQAMQAQAQDTFHAYVAKEWKDDGESLSSFEYLGNYLLTKKSTDISGRENVLYLVYKAQVYNSYTNEDEGLSYSATNDIYWFIRFSDLIQQPDGSLAVDLDNYDVPFSSFNVDSKIPTSYWGTKKWDYTGFPTLDELYSAAVTQNLEKYNHEDNVN